MIPVKKPLVVTAKKHPQHLHFIAKASTLPEMYQANDQQMIHKMKILKTKTENMEEDH